MHRNVVAPYVAHDCTMKRKKRRGVIGTVVGRVRVRVTALIQRICILERRIGIFLYFSKLIFYT